MVTALVAMTAYKILNPPTPVRLPQFCKYHCLKVIWWRKRGSDLDVNNSHRPPHTQLGKQKKVNAVLEALLEPNVNQTKTKTACSNTVVWNKSARAGITTTHDVMFSSLTPEYKSFWNFNTTLLTLSHVNITKGNSAYLLNVSLALVNKAFPRLLLLAAEQQHMAAADTDAPLPVTLLLQPWELLPQ